MTEHAAAQMFHQATVLLTGCIAFLGTWWALLNVLQAQKRSAVGPACLAITAALLFVTLGNLK